MNIWYMIDTVALERIWSQNTGKLLRPIRYDPAPNLGSRLASTPCRLWSSETRPARAEALKQERHLEYRDHDFLYLQPKTVLVLVVEVDLDTDMEC